jgi:hypothetical protein
VTELLDGRSLREVLAAGPLPPREAGEILDFGLAKLTQVDALDVADSRFSTDTAEGKVMGTIG